MVRLGSYSRADTFDMKISGVILIIDIFSKYKGEKEILDITSNITNHIQELRAKNPNIIFIMQKDLKILDDNKTGPVKKHGVLTYSFLLSSSIEEEEKDDDTEGN